VVQTDEDFLRIVIELARQARNLGEDPFGAVLVYGGEVVHKGYDRSIELCDPTAHVELQVIRDYCQAHRRMTLEGFTLYCSAEPCMMCSGAIHWTRISRVVFSVSQVKLQQVSGGKLKPSAASLINAGGRRIEIIGPLLAEEGLAIFENYTFISKAQRLKERLLH
jgi:tRNA(Arg) A34 adenosine deaminase TadA